MEEARERGFLGPGPVTPHIDHALGFAAAASDAPPGRALDLGSGGGVPGLVLAWASPARQWVLLEVHRRRSHFLGEAVARLGLLEEVEVWEERAEDAGRRPAARGQFALVVARSFGPPAVTAECAAPFLAVGGRLVVSEPPADGLRWPSQALAELGMEPLERIALAHGHYQVIIQQHPCPDRYPRRVGVPAKRPLFEIVSRETSTDT